MTAIECLVLESVRRLNHATKLQISGCLNEMTGKPVSQENVLQAIGALENRGLVSSSDKDLVTLLA